MGEQLGIHLVTIDEIHKNMSHRGWERGKMQEEECLSIIENRCLQTTLVFT